MTVIRVRKTALCIVRKTVYAERNRSLSLGQQQCSQGHSIWHTWRERYTCMLYLGHSPRNCVRNSMARYRFHVKRSALANDSSPNEFHAVRQRWPWKWPSNGTARQTVYIYTYTHTHTHTYIYIYTQAGSSPVESLSIHPVKKRKGENKKQLSLLLNRIRLVSPGERVSQLRVLEIIKSNV